MSGLQNGRAMDQASGSGGSVRRARERAQAQAELRRQAQEQSPSIPRLPIRNPNNGASKPQAPATLQTRDENGNIGLAISRPTPAPQWPLTGPIASPASSDGSSPYRPPPGKSQPPQRPPRPSRVPSMLDSSRVQDHTPVFQYTPQSQRASELSIPETPASASSRPTTQSSVGSIPDFPLPVAAPPPPPPPVSRRSVNLGPPPSSRRGASSFYSMASYVSPIPEESPRTRSHTSYASSAAIPESFGTLSPGLSQDGYYDDTIAEESVYSDDADERGLVRSASIGRKGKPSLVTTRSSEKGEMVPFVMPVRPNPKPVQSSPFSDGTGYIDESSSSSGGASSNKIPTVSADSMLGAFQAASATDPSSAKNAAPSTRPFRLSTLRRPPRLDLDAVKQAEARGSLTSLPDLIRRATRLAAMMDKGRRPGSRFDLDFPEDVYGRDQENDFAYDAEKHQSGLSDMLAAFPPPAQANNNPRRSIRQSIRQSGSSWPLPLGNRKSYRGPAPAEQAMDAPRQDPPRDQKKGRRCCGLPLWGFLLLLFILACIVTAAIVVPVEFFVIRKQVPAGPEAQPALSACQSQLTCANGGTNVITQGVCSCICSNGFTGTNCTVSGSQGCTTSTLSSTDTTVSNATLGEAVPRLVQQAQTNFSIALSAQTILSKFNSANLSCIAENALVTFNGESSRSTALALAAASDSDSDSALAQINAAVPVTVTILSGIPLTLTLDNPQQTGSFSVIVSTLTEPTTLTGSFSTVFRTTISDKKTKTSEPATTTTTTTTVFRTSASATASTTSTSSTTNPTATFTVTDEVLDFARVAVLFVLQEQSLAGAATAQTTLQKFFTDANSASSTGGVTVDQARSVSIGGGNTLDLVHFLVNLAS